MLSLHMQNVHTNKNQAYTVQIYEFVIKEWKWGLWS